MTETAWVIHRNDGLFVSYHFSGKTIFDDLRHAHIYTDIKDIENQFDMFKDRLQNCKPVKVCISICEEGK